ncbi:hypothetical protein P4647_25425 [Peribacillus frigoritolerans]|uniref:hypothetical protein n=1 Tax=Peribacillus TaxID=2675229 RepID=UPI002E2258F0|nr:hypothetical protein [Peribacillus frigoritolerans]
MKKENVSILKAAEGIELLDSTHSDEHEHDGNKHTLTNLNTKARKHILMITKEGKGQLKIMCMKTMAMTTEIWFH